MLLMKARAPPTSRTTEQANQSTLWSTYGYHLWLYASNKRPCRYAYACESEHKDQIKGLIGRTYACNLGYKGKANEHISKPYARNGGRKYQIVKLMVQHLQP